MQKRAQHKLIARAVFGVVFGAVSLLTPAAFAVPGVDEVTETATQTVTDTVDQVGGTSSGPVDQVTDTVDDATGGNTGGVTDTSGGLLKYLQSGNVQWYAVVLFVGVIALTIVFTRIP